MRASIHSLPVRPPTTTAPDAVTIDDILLAIDRLDAVVAAMPEHTQVLQPLRQSFLDDLEAAHNRQTVADRQNALLASLRAGRAA